MTYRKRPIDLLVEKKFLVALSVVLSGCSFTPKTPDVVRVPVLVKCIESIPQRPTLLSDAELLMLSDYALIISLAHERRVYQGWTADLEAALAGCR